MIIYLVFEGLGLSLFTLIHSAMLSSSACASATSFSLSFDALLHWYQWHRCLVSSILSMFQNDLDMI